MKLSEMVDQLNQILDTRGDLNVYLHDSNGGFDYDGMSIGIYEGYVDPEVNIGFDSEKDVR